MWIWDVLCGDPEDCKPTNDGIAFHQEQKYDRWSQGAAVTLSIPTYKNKLELFVDEFDPI